MASVGVEVPLWQVIVAALMLGGAVIRQEVKVAAIERQLRSGDKKFEDLDTRLRQIEMTLRDVAADVKWLTKQQREDQ